MRIVEKFTYWASFPWLRTKTWNGIGLLGALRCFVFDSGFALPLIVFVQLSFFDLNAQSQPISKGAEKVSTAGMKQKVEGNKKGTENSIKPLNSSTNSNVSESIYEGAEIRDWNYDNLSLAVKQQISHNKDNSKPLSEGIIKEYRIEIKQCISKEACQNTLAFLLNEKDIISFEYLEGHFVNIRVELSMKSEKLKEILSSKSLDFGFINENFLIRDTDK